MYVRNYPQGRAGYIVPLYRPWKGQELIERIAIFASDEAGSAAVDWIVLTAGAVMLGLTAVTAVQSSLVAGAESITAGVTVGGSP